MQDRNRQLDENLLRRTAGPYIRVRSGNPQSEQIESASPPKADIDAMLPARPLWAQKQTSIFGSLCRLCLVAAVACYHFQVRLACA
jgi:hypothetical protein